MHICVVVPVFNRADLLTACLDSIVKQDDDDFSVVIADDASTESRVESCGQAFAEAFDNVTYARRRKNLGATQNLVQTIRGTNLQPTDVVLIVDGDDRLSHPGALARIRTAYRGDVEMTYGSYYSDPFDPGCHPARPIPDEILTAGAIRSFTERVGQWFNHPLSFRRRAFDELAHEDFHWGLDVREPWMRYGYDITIGIPLLERVGRRAEWIPDLLYVYTSDRPEACWREHGEETSAEAREVFGWGWRHIPYET